MMGTVFFLVNLLGLQSAENARVLALIEQLKGEDPSARRRALEGLQERGKSAVSVVLTTLANERPGLEAEVAGWVAKLASPEWKARDAAQRALVALGRRAVTALAAHEKAPNLEVAWRVKAAIAEIEGGSVEETRSELQRNAGLCEFLGGVGDGGAVPILLKQLDVAPPGQAALADVHVEFQVRVIEALSRLRSALSADQVEVASDHAVQLLAGCRDRRWGSLLLEALGRFGSRSSVPSLVHYLQDGDRRDVHLKREAMHALAAIGEAKGIAAILRGLESEEVYVRDAAIEVIRELAGTHFDLDARLPAADQRVRVESARAWWEKKYQREWEE